MARVPYLDPEDLAADDRDLLRRPISLHRALANSPGGARAFIGLGQWIRFECGLDPRLRELAILQVGYLARSPYEWSHHVKIGMDFGVSEADIEGLIAETEGRTSALSGPDKLVLRAVREMTSDGAIAEDTFSQVQQLLGNQGATDLVLVAAFYNGVVRLLGSLAIDVEPDYQPWLDRFPLPKG